MKFYFAKLMLVLLLANPILTQASQESLLPKVRVSQPLSGIEVAAWSGISATLIFDAVLVAGAFLFASFVDPDRKADHLVDNQILQQFHPVAIFDIASNILLVLIPDLLQARALYRYRALEQGAGVDLARRQWRHIRASLGATANIMAIFTAGSVWASMKSVDDDIHDLGDFEDRLLSWLHHLGMHFGFIKDNNDFFDAAKFFALLKVVIASGRFATGLIVSPIVEKAMDNDVFFEWCANLCEQSKDRAVACKERLPKGCKRVRRGCLRIAAEELPDPDPQI